MPTPPAPPRMTGDPSVDAVSLNQWAWDFYRTVVLQEQYLEKAGQFDSSFDLTTLPDPATSTIATAQETANAGYAVALSSKQDASDAQDSADSAAADAATAQAAAEAAQDSADDIEDAVGEWVHGQVTIENTDTTGTATLSPDQSDALYLVIPSIGASAGAGIPAEAFLITGISSVVVGSFVVNLHTAPGAGNSVTVNYLVRR